MIYDRLANVVFAAVTVVYITGQFVDIFNITDFQVTDKFTGTFIGIVGAALIAKQRSSSASGGDHRK